MCTLYARPLPVSHYPPSSRKVVVTSMLGGMFVGVECVYGCIGIRDANVTQARRARHRFDACGDSQG